MRVQRAELTQDLEFQNFKAKIRSAASDKIKKIDLFPPTFKLKLQASITKIPAEKRLIFAILSPWQRFEFLS